MKYIFLAIVLFCATILIYIHFFNKLPIKEGLSYSEQSEHLKKQDKYYDHRKFPQIVPGGSDDVKFVALNLDKTKLEKTNPSANISQGEIGKKIEKCKIIDKNNDCNLIGENDCGYCWHTDKIMYGDANGPVADVCPKNGWIPPGPNASTDCQKKKERTLCATMADCGDATGEKSICAWCPVTNKGIPKKRATDGNGWVAKYKEHKCDWKSNKKELLGDSSDFEFSGNLVEPNMCKKFKQMFPCIGPNMFTGPHTPACLSNLWKKSGCSGDLNQRVTDRADYNWWNSHSYGDTIKNMKGFGKTAKESRNYKEANIASQKCFGKAADACDDRFNPRPLECSKKIYRKNGFNLKGKLNPVNSPNWPNGIVNSDWKNGQNGGWSISKYLQNLMGYKMQNIRDSVQPKQDFDRYLLNSYLVNGTLPEIPWEKPCWKDFIIIMTTNKYVTLLSNGNLRFSGGFNSFIPTQQEYADSTAGFKKNIHWVDNYELKRNVYNLKYFPFWKFIKLNRQIWDSQWNKFKSIMLKSRNVKTNATKVNAKWLGWNEGRRRGNTQKGEGDCDSDRDCRPGLKCFQRDGNEKVPGVRNTGDLTWEGDFCYDPNDSVLEGTDGLIISNGSNFDTIIETKNNLKDANRLGTFYKSGKNRILTKQAFMHEDFPFWLFIRRAERS
jgi:hypothetical protein